MPNNYTDTKVNDMIFNVLDSDTYNTLSSGGSLSANELYFITDDEKIDIEYIVGTQASATNVWTGNSRDKALNIGKIIAYKLPVAGTSDAATLTLTMSGGAVAGPIQIKRKGTGNTTTHYSAGEVIFMAYDGTYWQTNSYYDSNSNDTTTTYARYTYAQIAPTTALYRYQLLLPSFSDTTRAIPLNTTSNTTGTSKATITTESFNPFDQIYYYSTTSTVAAGTAIGASYIWYAYCRVNLQYSFNTASTLTAHKDVYLVAQMQSDGSAKLRNPGATGSDASAQATGANAGPITQTLPSTDDGYIYIKLGRACDTYRIDLTITHPIYVYKNGALRTLSGYAEYAALAAEATHAVNASTADLATEATHAASATTADSATTATNATNASNVPWSGVSGKPSSFTPSSHTHGNIQNGGTLQTNDVAIASGDKLVITDSSDGNKVARTSTTFGTSTTTFLNNKGEWATPAGNYTLPKATTSTLGGVIVGSGISVNSSTGAISVSAANLGLSNALHFIGKATVVITDGSTTDPVISGYDFDNAKQAGDVIIDKDNSDEYVWTAEGKWERLGPDGSYALSSHTHGNITNAGELGTASRMVVTDSNKKITILDATVSSPSASGTATAFISSVSQSSQGKISATKANLPTASTATAGIVQLGTTSGTAAEGNHTHTTTIATSTGTNQITLAHGGKYSITAGGTSYVFTMPASGNTDRYVNSASFADDTTNTAASPVKMTLTRAGSDTATVTANIPKVSSSSAGVAPKGAAVTSQSQSTKFLREDGTWAAPSYTTNSNTTYTFENGTNGSFTVTPSGGSAQTVSIGKPATAGTADSANAVAWANVSGKPSSYTPAAHTHYELATIGDQRSTATTPNTYSNRFIFQGLKTNTVIGSPSTDTYSYLIGLRGWSDQSGGKSHELAFNNTGIYWRMGSTTEWDSWYRIYTTANKPTASDVGLGNVTNHQQVHDVAWDSSNKKITRSKNGTAGDVVQFVAGSNVTLTAESGKLTIASSYTNTNYYHTTGSWSGLTYTATANGGAGALAFTIPTGTTSTTVALGNHTHATSIATSTGTNQITLAHGGKYAITAGGTSYIFTMPSDNNTDTLVTQTATDTTNANYELLFSATADNTTRTETARKTSNLIFNPSTGLLTTKNISLTGDLTITGDAYLNNQTYAEDITAGTLLVNGNTNFVAIPTAPTAADGTNDTQLATTAFVYNAFKSNDAMVFKGVVNSNSDLPATHYQGWTYKIGTAGTYAGQTCEIGDTIYCITDGTAANNAHWVVVQNNLSISTTAPSSSSTDGTIPSSKAVWTAISTASGYGKTGTVTSVAASGSGGISISGSPITTSGTIAIGLNLSTAINGLGEGTSAAQRDDYIVAQYAGGGTTTTTYHRRKLSNIFKALNSGDITTALGYTPYNSTNPNGYTSNTGTVTSVATGAGLTGGTITTSGTIKANLNSETSLGTIGTTSKLYAVGVDANGKLCVNVPWTEGALYSAGTGLSLSGTTFSVKLGYTTSGNNRAVQSDSNGNLYVVQTDNNTTYSAGTGLSLSSTTFSVKLGYTTSGNNRAVQADSNGNLYVTQKDDNTTYSAGTGLSLSSNSFSVKLGYTTSGNNRAVQADTNGNLYVTQKDDNTIYSAGTGLSLSGTTFNHSNSVTAKTSYGSTATTASANGGTIKVTDVQYDAQGHITASTDRTITLSQTTYTLSGLGGVGTVNASGTAPLTLSASKSGTTVTLTGSVSAATTAATGIVQLNSAVNSSVENQAATPKAVKTAYDLANAHKYWANIEATSSATYSKAPEMATIKLNGNTSASSASTKNVTLIYDSSLETLNFVFA